MKKLPPLLIVENDVVARITLESVLTDITSVAVDAQNAPWPAARYWANDLISPLLMSTPQMVARLGWRLP